MLETFINATAWTMQTPKAYGPFHLIFSAVGLAVSLLLAYLLRRTGEKANRRILVGVSLFLIIAEVYKQLFYYYHIGGGSYQWWIFPFQLCSVPMYLCLLAAFIPDGKLKNSIYDFMLSYNLMGGLMALIEPSGIVHGYWTLTLHAFVWHISLIFLGMYLWASNRAARKVSDFKYSVILYIVLSAVAFCINLVCWNAAEGDINMFFVGPRISPLLVFEDIATKFGWYVCTPLFLFASSLAAGLVFAACCGLRKIKIKKP